MDTSVEDYDEMMDTNVRSTFLFTRYAVPVMIKQGSGTILMISSMAGIMDLVVKRFTTRRSSRRWDLHRHWTRNCAHTALKVEGCARAEVKTDQR